jgi:hypothetical protein
MGKSGTADFFETTSQPDLFGPAVTPGYTPDPRHVRNRLAEMLAAMQAAERWPWAPVMVKLYRGTVWPYLYERLPDREEAAHWRQLIDAEIARLEAA